MVSRRAAALTARPPAIAAAHFRAEADPYHPLRRPGGYLNLGTAENRLVWDLLRPRLAARRPPAAADAQYAPLHGAADFREVLARFLGGVCRTGIDPDHLVVVSGVTSALDIIASVLCDPGDAIIVPAPYYGAFEIDLAGRSGARLLPVQIRGDDTTEDGGTPGNGNGDGDGGRAARAINRALTDARRRGVTVRAVALASPGNPVGHVHSARELRAICEVAGAHGVDVIADEIYANSVFGPAPFVSVLDPEVDASGTGTRAHMLWGFAKDFGLPGFKVGVLHCPDPQIRAAARAFAYFAPISTDTQAVLRDLLTDTAWVTGFLTESRRRLGASYAQATGMLATAGIPFVPVDAGFSVWADLRAWLAVPAFAAEHALWERIFEELRVNILPGQEFAAPEPGWFRICHATDRAVVSEGLRRIAGLPRATGPDGPPGAGSAPGPDRAGTPAVATAGRAELTRG